MAFDHNITSAGPMVELTIGLSILSVHEWNMLGLTIPSTIAVVGLIDTGADVTTVSPSVIRRLGLSPFDTRKVLTATGISPCNMYEVCLAFQDHEFPSCDVLEAQQDFRTHELLLGRNILDHAVFHYDGPRGVFTLQFE